MTRPSEPLSPRREQLDALAFLLEYLEEVVAATICHATDPETRRVAEAFKRSISGVARVLTMLYELTTPADTRPLGDHVEGLTTVIREVVRDGFLLCAVRPMGAKVGIAFSTNLVEREVLLRLLDDVRAQIAAGPARRGQPD